VVTASSLTLVQGGENHNSLAHFTDNLTHRARDFTATITFSDGATAHGCIVATRMGGFEVLAAHHFNVAGANTFTVTITAKSGLSASADGAVAVTPRVLTATGINSTTDRKSIHDYAVATLTDNLPGLCGKSYTISVTWSDGITTTAKLCMSGGVLTIKTSRDLPGPGALTGTVNISVLDGAVTTSANFTLTVNAPKSAAKPANKGK
jgi:hypothetical protein